MTKDEELCCIRDTLFCWKWGHLEKYIILIRFNLMKLKHIKVPFIISVTILHYKFFVLSVSHSLYPPFVSLSLSLSLFHSFSLNLFILSSKYSLSLKHIIYNIYLLYTTSVYVVDSQGHIHLSTFRRYYCQIYYDIEAVKINI